MDAVGFQYFAQLEPEAPAVVDPFGRTHSRREVAAASNRMARALRARGMRAGDSIAVMLPNCVEYLHIYLAAMQIGLHIASINWHLSSSEIGHILADSKARAWVTHERFARAASEVVPTLDAKPELLFSAGRIEGFENIADLVSEHSAAPVEDPVRGRVLSYTSATTGRPKGIDLPLQDADVALERIERAYAICGVRRGEENVHLCSSMLYHAAPLEWATMALHLGHVLVLTERWEPESLLCLIDRHRVTTTFMVPTMFVRLLKLPEQVRARYSTAHLRFVGHGAAPCPPEVKRQMIDWWGPIIWEAYGCSEGSGTLVDSNEWLKYPGTVGRPIPGSRIKILDEAGEEVAPGVVGTIYLTRYTGDRFAYRGDPEKTRAAYRGEFFTVGDMGYLNAQGYLFICDRKADMIICGGVNVYPAEIEGVLVQHPKVADCVVFGIPDALMGEAIKAVIQPVPGVEPGPSLTIDILDFLGARLAAGKLPRRVEYTTELPRDPNGKIYKRLLRAPHWAGRERAI